MFPNWCSLKWVGRAAANPDHLCSSKANDASATKAKVEKKQSVCSYIAAGRAGRISELLDVNAHPRHLLTPIRP